MSLLHENCQANVGEESPTVTGSIQSPTVSHNHDVTITKVATCCTVDESESFVSPRVSTKVDFSVTNKEKQQSYRRRIPSALQAVFLASNQGRVVTTPPTNNMASKIFYRAAQSWSKSRSDSTRSSRNESTFWRPSRSKSKRRTHSENAGSSMQSSISKSRASNRSSTDTRSAKCLRFQSESFQEKMLNPSSELGTNEFSLDDDTFSLTTLQVMEASIESPQTLLNKILSSRGYPTETSNALETDYYSVPSTYRIGRNLIEAVNQNDKAMLATILNSSCDGNPCNEDGYSLLHMICRKAKVDLFMVLLAQAEKKEDKTIVSICDNYGRTPLHEACCAAPVDSDYFAMIKRLLDIDITLLFLKDCRGCLPLSYVRPEYFQYWNSFLHNKKDLYWAPNHNFEKKDSMKGTRHIRFSPGYDNKRTTGTPSGKNNSVKTSSFKKRIDNKSTGTCTSTLDVCADTDADNSLFLQMEAEMKIILNCMDGSSQEQIPWT